MATYAISWMSYLNNEVEISFVTTDEGWEAALRQWLDEAGLVWVVEEADRRQHEELAGQPLTINDYQAIACDGDHALGFAEVPNGN